MPRARGENPKDYAARMLTRNTGITPDEALEKVRVLGEIEIERPCTCPAYTFAHYHNKTPRIGSVRSKT